MHDVQTILTHSPRVRFDITDPNHIKIVQSAYDAAANTFKWGPNGCPFLAEGTMTIRDTIAKEMFANISKFKPTVKKK